MEAFAARVVSGQEEERRHIAQELHDGPVQTLIHLCRQIDEMSSYGEPTPEGAVELADLRSIVEGTVAELRSIAKGLRPSVLDDLGLVASINQILAEAGERHQFETSFGVTGTERRLSPTVELALFRIAQEAISNIERHAAANHVAIGMSFEHDGLRLLVKDDGIGFDQADDRGIEQRFAGAPGHDRTCPPDRVPPRDPLRKGPRDHRGHMGSGNDSRSKLTLLLSISRSQRGQTTDNG